VELLKIYLNKRKNAKNSKELSSIEITNNINNTEK
jgi:hypothetical protein